MQCWVRLFCSNAVSTRPTCCLTILHNTQDFNKWNKPYLPFQSVAWDFGSSESQKTTSEYCPIIWLVARSAACDSLKTDFERRLRTTCLTLAFFYHSTQWDCCLDSSHGLTSPVLVVELISRGEGSPSTLHNRLKLRWTMVDQRKSDPKVLPSPTCLTSTCCPG